MSTVPVSRSVPDSGLDAALEGRTSQDQSFQALERAEPNARLLVLSRNPDVVTVVRNAARSVSKVFHSRDLDDAARSLPELDPGVLVVDGAITADVSVTLTQITRRFPEAVIVVVGTREESSELMQLAAAGRIFRFLLMPLSFGPARLALAAAVTHHIERKAVTRRIGPEPEDPSPSARKHVFAYLVLAAVLLALMGGLWRISGSLAAKPAPVVAKAAPVVSAPNPLLGQLARAAEQMKQGHSVEPADSSALALYRAVLRADPNNAVAQRGIRAIADEFLQQAEQALLAEQLDEVERLLTLVQAVEATHPRLAFLDSRLAREHELHTLSEQRQVGNKVRQLTSAARSELSAGNLIGTGTGGALGSLLAARRLDPNDLAVVQATRELNLALADAVRMALNAGDAPRAQAFANAARKLGSGEQLLAAIDRSVKEPVNDSKRAPGPPTPAPAALAPTPPPSPIVTDRIEEVIASVAPAAPAIGAEEVLQAASLPRIKEVFPSYPKSAAASGLEGYVDLEFTIATDGVPRNLTVLGATPRRVFDNAALSCVRQWRFEPLQQDGLPVARRATLRVRFELK